MARAAYGKAAPVAKINNPSATDETGGALTRNGMIEALAGDWGAGAEQGLSFGSGGFFEDPMSLGGPSFGDSSGFEDPNTGLPWATPGDPVFDNDFGVLDAGSFARGGSFRVPNRGRGGVDGTRIGMNVTPGEQVSVTSNEERIGGAKQDGGGVHIANINIVTPGDNPMASLSRNAIRRELSAWMR